MPKPVQPASPASGTGLPLRCGLSFKPEHFRALLETQPDIGFFEIHAENYMVEGGPLHHCLGQIRSSYPLSLHGVGLSIGGEGELDAAHLDRLATLIERYAPAAFSEHLAWSSHGGVFLDDLLPLLYERDSLDRVCAHVDQVQTHLGRRMLLENPATYVEFAASTFAEAEFISEVVARTGCGLLLDVSNAYLSCVNHGRDPWAYIEALPLAAVGQIHLAGFARDTDAGGDPLLIDTHGAPVAQAVWDLYRRVLGRVGAMPTLIERDNDIPPLPVLLAEARCAEGMLQELAP